MNEKYVINIGRQYGSGGLKIAQRLSKMLGINYYDKKLLEIAAKKSGISEEHFAKLEEKTPSGVIGDLSGWASSVFTGVYGNDSFLLDESLFKIQSDIIRQIARKESCIFVGRCADYALREHPRAANVFICAGKEERVKNIISAAAETAGEDKIRKAIETTDKQRAKYYNFYSSKTWGLPESYHICLNSAALGVEGCAETIRDFAKRKTGCK